MEVTQSVVCPPVPWPACRPPYGAAGRQQPLSDSGKKRGTGILKKFGLVNSFFLAYNEIAVSGGPFITNKGEEHAIWTSE